MPDRRTAIPSGNERSRGIPVFAQERVFGAARVPAHECHYHRPVCDFTGCSSRPPPWPASGANTRSPASGPPQFCPSLRSRTGSMSLIRIAFHSGPAGMRATHMGLIPTATASSSHFEKERVGDGVDRGAPKHWTSNIKNPPVQCVHANFDVRFSSSGLLPGLDRGNAVVSDKKTTWSFTSRESRDERFLCGGRGFGGESSPREIFSHLTVSIRRISRWVTPCRHGGERFKKKKERSPVLLEGTAFFLAWRN